MAQYTALIPQNTALSNARRIGIYNSKGNRVGFIPLGNLAPINRGKKLYSFGAISDGHYPNDTSAEDYARALAYFHDELNLPFSIVCGDITEHGTAEEWAWWRSFSENYPVYVIAGNHDGFTYDGSNAIEAESITGFPFYYSFTHGDDVFIMLGCTNSDGGASFVSGELQWLYETLEENREKRCFVFFHIRPDTSSGNALGAYAFDIWDGTETTVFESLLTHYPNVSFFHGHSHMKFYLQEKDDNANYKQNFGKHDIHIPSVTEPRDTTGGTDRWDVMGDSEGYVVDVYEKGIHLRGRDFVKGEFLPIASYWLDTAVQEVAAGTYTDETGTLVHILPETYQRVGWIGTTGTQYIDTGIVPTDHMVEVKYDSEEYNNDEHLFGTATTNSARYFHFTLYSNKYYWGLNGAESKGGAWSTGVKTLLYNYGDDHEVIQDGVVLGSGSYITSAGYLTLSRRTAVNFKGKYYYFKVTDRATGLLVRDMIPCYRKADGVIGMYDTISGQFFTNAGTGEFRKGSDVMIPTAYQQVEWIGASGNQWINTGITPKSDDVVWECEWTETTLEKGTCLFASTLVNYDTELGNRFSGNLYHPGEGRTSFSIAKSSDICQYSGLQAGVKNTLAITAKNGTVTRVINGDSVTQSYVGTIQNGVNIGLFATNRDTTVHEYCKYTRMYSWKMWDGGALVRDMIPCYRKADGEIGMYDAVSKQFFVNSGSGTFTKGADV